MHNQSFTVEVVAVVVVVVVVVVLVVVVVVVVVVVLVVEVVVVVALTRPVRIALPQASCLQGVHIHHHISYSRRVMLQQLQTSEFPDTMCGGGRDVSIYCNHDLHIQIGTGLPGLDLLHRLHAVDPQTRDA